jgi:hypothetical protein
MGIFVDGGIPYVMYSAPPVGKANVKKYAGGVWQSVGQPDFSEGGAWYGSLVRSEGVSYVALQDEAGGGKATVMRLTGGAWAYVGEPHFTASKVQFTTLQISNGTLYLAFKDFTTKRPTVMRWVPEG